MSALQQQVIKFGRNPYRTHELLNLLYPHKDGQWRDVYRSGWQPSWFNQQWGGPQWGGLPDGSFGSVATGNIQDDTALNCGDVTGAGFYRYQPFFLSDGMTSPVIWIKAYKVGNPVGNMQVGIWSDNAGVPNALVGSAATLAGTLITSKTDGEWYAFSPTPGALTANTKYHVVVSNTGTINGTDYFKIKATASSKYPNWTAAVANGGACGTGTNVPAWAVVASNALCFLTQNTATTSMMQTGGQFDYKLSFAPGNPVNQSRSLVQPLVNFYDGRNFTALFRGTYAVSTNVLDFLYGIDHDRITLTINASGYPVLNIYRQDRTLYSLTGATSVTSGFHDVGFRIRTLGDGADYATLYIDGVSVASSTAQTYTMDANMRQLGTARLGDGFGLTPSWTQDMQMGSLPSAQGWTWSGTGTQGSCMVVSNNKLYQVQGGYTTNTFTGYYSKTVSFVNATGWTVAWKCRVPSSPNTAAGLSAIVNVFDGNKQIIVGLNEYFIQIASAANLSAPDFTIQGDFRNVEHSFVLCGKSSDYYLFMDGKLVVDGTGKLSSSSATNAIYFGDNDATAAYNSDVVWSYMKYYQGGTMLPTATTGSCSEFVYWSGDHTSALSDLYAAGTPIPAKQYCGMERNYVESIPQKEVRRGVTSAPATGSTSMVLITDMDSYVTGSELSAIGYTNLSNSAANASNVQIYVDGIGDYNGYGSNVGTNIETVSAALAPTKVQPGLHKMELRFSVAAGTGTGATTQRKAQFETRG